MIKSNTIDCCWDCKIENCSNICIHVKFKSIDDDCEGGCDPGGCKDFISKAKNKQKVIEILNKYTKTLIIDTHFEQFSELIYNDLKKEGLIK